MTRPKTKAEPVVIRLTLAAMAEAEKRAAAKGLGVRIWVEQAVERSLTGTVPAASPTGKALQRDFVEPRQKKS